MRKIKKGYNWQIGLIMRNLYFEAKRLTGRIPQNAQEIAVASLWAHPVDGLPEKDAILYIQKAIARSSLHAELQHVADRYYRDDIQELTPEQRVALELSGILAVWALSEMPYVFLKSSNL